MRRIGMLGLLLLAGGFAAVTVVGQEDKQQPESFWMKKKLEYAKNILEGVTIENFEAVRESAGAMRRLSALEGFARRKDTKAYRAQLAIFEFATDELLRAAEEKDVDGAALAFTQLTLSCVNCHRQLRLPQQ